MSTADIEEWDSLSNIDLFNSIEKAFDIKNRLGHQSIESTMIYLHLDLSRKRDIQKKFIEYTQSKVNHDSKINELIDWLNSVEILAWLDSL